MKTTTLVVLVLIFAIQFVSGQSKVAVLDASLGAGVHPNASAIVADTINEQFVKSADFIAIDRVYISSIQEEKKLQLSGDVDSDDIKELGATFGAKYLCIANVSQLGSTFTVSARLIEVETAQVVVQESARRQGQIDVLFNIAEVVGAKLIGKEIVTSEPVQAVRETTPTKPAPSQPAKTSYPAKAFSRMTVSYMMPTYTGSGRDLMETSQLWDYETWTYGFDIHSLIPFGQFFYYAVSGSVGFEDVYDWVNDENTNSTINLDLRATMGGLYPLGKIMQFYGGIGLGYQLLTKGDFWGIDYETEAGTFVYGFELGGDYRLGDFVLTMRMQTGMSTFPAYTVFLDYDEDFGYTAFMIGAGFVF